MSKIDLSAHHNSAGEGEKTLGMPGPQMKQSVPSNVPSNAVSWQTGPFTPALSQHGPTPFLLEDTMTEGQQEAAEGLYALPKL